MQQKVTNNYTTETKTQIKEADLVVLVCDFDGTLTPMPQRPEEVHMADTVRDLLVAIDKIPGVRLAIMSERPPIDLKPRMELPNCHYLCNHGLEISGPEVNHIVTVANRYRADIQRAVNTLRVQLRVPQVVIEDRGLTAAINYRSVQESEVNPLLAKAHNLLASSVRERQIRIEQGRRKLEILPAVDWDRGKAVQLLFHNFRAIYKDKNALLLYVGDDIMDESAFRYTMQVGIPYRVSQARETFARYYLKNQTEISRLLKIVKENGPDEPLEAPKEKFVL